jgi:protein TonB
MTSAFLHPIHVGTLATWLSVAGFGTVGVIAPERAGTPPPAPVTETSLLTEDFTLGDNGSTDPIGAATAENAGDQTSDIPETLPSPPVLEPLAELPPLPQIPDLPPQNTAPSPASASAATRDAPPTKPRPTGARNSAHNTPGSSTSSGNSTAGTARGGISTSAGSGMSSSARLAAGRMPPPSYPSEARRKGQKGTVVIEFVVDTNGRVISAYAKSPSPWPLLNDEAVRTVRRWKFPPGGVMKLQRPIVFQIR